MGRRLAAGASLVMLLAAVTALVVGGLVLGTGALVSDTPAAVLLLKKPYLLFIIEE